MIRCLEVIWIVFAIAQIICSVHIWVHVTMLQKYIRKTSNSENGWNWEYTYKAQPETGDSPVKHTYRT